MQKVPKLLHNNSLGTLSHRISVKLLSEDHTNSFISFLAASMGSHISLDTGIRLRSAPDLFGNFLHQRQLGPLLGLVTTKRPELEDKAAVIARIHDAAKYIPLDRLCLSPQCGFASCEIGNKLTEAQQWAKLALVKEIAEEVWG